MITRIVLLIALAAASPAAALPAAAENALGPDVARALARSYPEDQRAMAEALDREAADHPGDAAALARRASALLIIFYKSRLSDLVNAPAPVLNSITMRQRGLARDLARADLPLCARLAPTGFVGALDMPPAFQPRASALAAAMIDAAKAGAGRPRDPRRETLSGEDAGAWYAKLIEVEPSSDVQAVVAAGQSAGEAESAEMKCKVANALYSSISALPSDQAANVGAFFLAQNLADLTGE